MFSELLPPLFETCSFEVILYCLQLLCYSCYKQQNINAKLQVSHSKEIDDRQEKIGKKIRDTELEKIPYMLIVGEKEQEEGKVSVRKQGEGDLGSILISEFADKINQEVADKIAK